MSSYVIALLACGCAREVLARQRFVTVRTAMGTLAWGCQGEGRILGTKRVLLAFPDNHGKGAKTPGSAISADRLPL